MNNGSVRIQINFPKQVGPVENNFLGCTICGNERSSYILSCYFTNWGQYQRGAGKHLIADLDPFLCDHLIYAFACMANNEIKTSKWNDEILFGQFQTLKNQNSKSNLKTLLVIGDLHLPEARSDRVWDSTQMVPYNKQNVWVRYNNVKSLQNKICVCGCVSVGKNMTRG
uniref:GH18 domain-containing protein n=1 Tax=Hucho hucho TaxID=62062 RepID=A0A4W5QQU6_9TELE